MARQGGLGNYFIRISIEANKQSKLIKLKRSEKAGVIQIFFLTSKHQVYDADILVGKYRISGVPVVNN